MLEDLEINTDDTLLSELRVQIRALTSHIRRLGKNPNEDKLGPVLEQFCYNIGDIAQSNEAFGSKESKSIRNWYIEYATDKELCITDLDDLDDAPSW